MNTYGYVLMIHNKLKEAIQVFTINSLAYPDEAYLFSNLGRAHLKAGNNELAVTNFQKALELDPENKRALKELEAMEKEGE